ASPLAGDRAKRLNHRYAGGHARPSKPYDWLYRLSTLEVNLKGAGSAIFAGVLLLVAGTLNIICGIRAVDDANFFVNNTQFVFSSLHTWGWVSIILGALQVTGGVSPFGGGLYG